VRDQIVFIGVAQEKAKAFSGTKVNGKFQFNRDKTVYVNHYGCVANRTNNVGLVG
jgi:hypothetical protein